MLSHQHLFIFVDGGFIEIQRIISQTRCFLHLYN